MISPLYFSILDLYISNVSVFLDSISSSYERKLTRESNEYCIIEQREPHVLLLHDEYTFRFSATKAASPHRTLANLSFFVDINGLNEFSYYPTFETAASITYSNEVKHMLNLNKKDTVIPVLTEELYFQRSLLEDLSSIDYETINQIITECKTRYKDVQFFASTGKGMHNIPEESLLNMLRGFEHFIYGKTTH